jgi:hypothetical protein
MSKKSAPKGGGRMRRPRRVLRFRLPEQHRVRALFDHEGQRSEPTDLGLVLHEMLQDLRRLSPSRARDFEQGVGALLLHEIQQLRKTLDVEGDPR